MSTTYDTPELDLTVGLPGVATPTELRLRPNISLDEWREAGVLLGRLRASSNFWVGDWLVYGETWHGERYAQAMDATGLQPQSLFNLANVSRKVAPQTRRQELTWAHHAEVARFDDAAKQTWWLEKAIAEQWSAKALRAAIREEIQQAGGTAARPLPATVGERVEAAVRAALEEWHAVPEPPDLDEWLPGRVRALIEEQS